ncbi:Signal transduction histidine-protein kinase/phosphatase DegS [Roseimaritima multifibrata]|uniref:Signal transduction histidine-protein kinase/phosphatase DegS n=1 Tax=Roseimaritima multifibrata TaxID=1930274 RepID=A0A517MKP9_9BACT|nr:sensor histidine kinase [Roseimaritima multifibrata]QDS95420.1 Signal transduction histidine-protein kinase/phosphatase DegS [Roseimaritima multifibrata]
MIPLLEQQEQRFSHELHDALLPFLFAARMRLESLIARDESEGVRDELRAILEHVSQASSEGRRLIVESHPPELAEIGWTAALQHYVRQGLPPHQVVIDFDFDQMPAAGNLQKDLALALYRVSQEAIRNAIRHAKAKRILVTAKQDPGGVLLTIEDDGCGFDTSAEKNQSRFGLRSLQARAEDVGGQLQIESAVGKGTTIEMRVPAAPKVS